MKKTFIIGVILVLTIGVFWYIHESDKHNSAAEKSNVAPDQKVTYSVGTTSVGGVYNTVATAWAQTLERHSYINWDVQTTGGAVGNLQLYGNGEIDMPMSIAASMLEATQGGTKSFPKPLDFTALMKVNQGFLHIIARKDSGIKDITDLKGKVVSTAEPGHSTEMLINALFDILGYDINTDIKAQRLNLQDSVDALADARIDAMFYLGGCPVASIQEACVNTGSGYILSIDSSIIDKVHKKYSHIVKAVANVGVFNNTEPVTTLGCNNFLCASRKMSENDVYETVKCLFENAQEWRECHSSVKDLSPQNALEGCPVDVHPGAIRYYKELGIKF